MNTLTPAQRRALAVMPLTGRAPHANRGTPPRPHFDKLRAYQRAVAKQNYLRGLKNNADGLMANGQPWRPELLHPRKARNALMAAE